MSKENEIQNEEYYLPGNLGMVKVGSAISAISSIFQNKKEGSVTITVLPVDLTIPPGVQQMLDDYKEAKEWIINQAGISEDKQGVPEQRTSSGLIKYFEPKQIDKEGQ